MIFNQLDDFLLRLVNTNRQDLIGYKTAIFIVRYFNFTGELQNEVPEVSV